MWKRCVLFFILFLFSCLNLSYGQKDPANLDLEHIVISKSSFQLIDSYSLKSESVEELHFSSPISSLSFLPLDLQSRSPIGSIQTDFSLRGSTFQGVLLLLDGERINDPQTAHHNSDIPITKVDIERIDLIPGLSSARFGPDSIGGAINFQIKKPNESKRILESSLAEFGTKYGLFSISEIFHDFGLRFSLENHESDGFREDTDFKKFTSHLSSYLEIPDGEFNLNLGYQEKEFGAYDFYTPGLNYLSKEWTKTYLMDAGFELELDELLIKPNFLWRRHYDKFLLDKTLLRSNYLNHHRTDLYTPKIYFQRQFNENAKAGFGLEYGEERINSTNLGKHNRNHESLFFDSFFAWNERLSSELSFRADDFDGFRRTYTGSMASSFDILQASSLNFGISRSIRIPSFTELYYNDPLTIGDPGLSAEKSINIQLGYNYQISELSYGVILFFRKEKDLIDWIKYSPIQTKWQVENISKADVCGVENYFIIVLNEYLKLNTNYTYLNKRSEKSGYLYKYGPNYIRHLVNMVLSTDLPFGVQTIGINYKKKPNRDGWLLLSIGLSYDLNKNSQIFLRGTNILNVEYQEIEGIPQPGRCVEAGLRISW